MASLRDISWCEDVRLQEDLRNYVRQNMKRKEMLDFLKRDFPTYAWSIPTLDRRLRYFNIFYTDTNVTLDEVKEAVGKELEGPGKLLGYRALHQKIRQEHLLNVPRDLVYTVMKEMDPEGLESRAVGVKNKKKKQPFTTRGPNWVHSVDGHNKLMGFQNDTFPLAIYGSIDTASRKLLWLRVWTNNREPRLIGRWYLEYLYESKVIPSYLRMDRGTETGVMATMHAFLRQDHGDIDPIETVIYGPSTANQVSFFVQGDKLYNLFVCYNLWHTITEANGFNAKESRTPHYSRTPKVQKTNKTNKRKNNHSNTILIHKKTF